jgi:hypothetical protein
VSKTVLRTSIAILCGLAGLVAADRIVFGQAGSTGGTLGKTDKSSSGGDEAVRPRKPTNQAAGGPKTFELPTINGTRVDWCLKWNGGLGAECGEPAATAFCKSKGFSRGSNWSQEQIPTVYLIGEKRTYTCPFVGCSAFVRVTCD